MEKHQCYILLKANTMNFWNYIKHFLRAVHGFERAKCSFDLSE